MAHMRRKAGISFVLCPLPKDHRCWRQDKLVCDDTPAVNTQGRSRVRRRIRRTHLTSRPPGWHSDLPSGFTQSERGAFEIVASKLIGEFLDGCLNRPIKQIELVEAFEAALNVAASNELRYGEDSAEVLTHRYEDCWDILFLASFSDRFINERLKCWARFAHTHFRASL